MNILHEDGESTVPVKDLDTLSHSTVLWFLFSKYDNTLRERHVSIFAGYNEYKSLHTLVQMADAAEAPWLVLYGRKSILQHLFLTLLRVNQRHLNFDWCVPDSHLTQVPMYKLCAHL